MKCRSPRACCNWSKKRRCAKTHNGLSWSCWKSAVCRQWSRRFCFEAVVNGSIAHGAALEIVDVPGVGWCMPCGESVAMDEVFGACPRCGSYQLQPTGGTDMRVREIEIE